MKKSSLDLNYLTYCMKNILLLIILLFSLSCYSQFITVDETYTTQELIEDILINSPCSGTSNYLAVTGTDFGEGNGIAAFNANGSDFPYQEGIILSSGFVSNAPGPNLHPNTNNDGSTNWPGDSDLDAFTNVNPSTNASFIQFDFIPAISTISFNFLFVSDEYNQFYECSYSDAFAFIITDQVTGVAVNLAVLPGTTIPIECTNIHPDVTELCPSINELYFEKYNFSPFNDENTAAINFNGQTVSLVAEGEVVVGNPYTIKLVVGDDGNGFSDTILDSAVFLEAGSFNTPSITDPISDYQLCDNDGDGSETFDLTSKYDEIVNTLTDITLTYYNTEADANADTNAIATPSAYYSSGAETIWVRAINTEGCTSVGFFNLIIDTAPLFTEVPLFQICDDTSPDGFTEFDLDSL